MTKTFQDETLFGFSNFGHWNLFDICNLIFVIFELPTKQIPSWDNQSLVLWARILYFTTAPSLADETMRAYRAIYPWVILGCGGDHFDNRSLIS
jgi:hypothetical protein